MNTYHLVLSQWQIEFLRWINEGHDEKAWKVFCASPYFLRSVKHLHQEGLIVWNSEDAASMPLNEIFALTDKGRAALVLTK
jgi:hypothetical protein